MPEQDPYIRVKNFNEVPLGLRMEQAILEAYRCMQCQRPTCIEGCPVNIDIKEFIGCIRDSDMIGAIRKIKETNSLPAICGRVCPQEIQCESKCILGRSEEPVAIGNLERFVADYERAIGVHIPKKCLKSEKKVAVIGSGPSGLTMASEMIKCGHEVIVYEALHELGGVLVYGIPEFRLPKEIVRQEIDYLKKIGVIFKTNHVIGKIFTINELFDDLGFNAVYIATGAGLPKFMNIPGENAPGVFSANEYLTRMNLMKAYMFPSYDTPNPRGRRAVVVGGGNVAMDCARTALRSPGTENVTLIYRRSREEMPARNEEIIHAEHEGIDFHLLTNPISINQDKRGNVSGVTCVKMVLGEPDDSGRRKPIPLEGSEYDIGCDMVVIAIGTGPNEILFQGTENLKRNKRGYIEVDPETGRTSIEGVWAGGDIVTGSATVILAMGAAKKAASDINSYLKSN
ncbi:NADPH-dependent glutamate synthase [candidate division WOR-3 bacterium]|nr:NADPH-dependent glutamate synthase [candidate division WOR-3 bacterium]